jgi:Ca-activated chloride channel family protein
MENQKKGLNKRIIIFLIIAAAVIFGVTFAIISATGGSGDTVNRMTYEQAEEQLGRMLKSVYVQEVPAVKAAVEYNVSDLKEELPDISNYPLSVGGGGAIDIEIVSSTEKAGSGTDGWLNEVAENFNKENFNINGQSVSVSVRPISSGVAADYIISGKYIPEAFSPSNELWGEMIKTKSNVDITLKNARLAGNVTGILLKQSKYDELKEKYGNVDIQSVIKETVSNGLAMGYTNPFASSTGLNFIISALYSADQNDLLSSAAVDQFQQFQANVPFVAYTTIQMRDAATKQNGSLDALVMEYQTYKNTMELRDFVFVPFGVRHDSPIYALGTLPPEKSQLLDMFIQYCLNEKSQKLASEYGFNNLNDYTSQVPLPSGTVITSAQSLWKEVKDAGRPVAAVFIADISGSMNGEPIMNLKQSLINGSQYINQKNLIGLVSYDNDVYINLPVAEFDLNQRSKFCGAVQDMSPGGQTATYDAILVGLQMLDQVKQKDPQTKLMLFVLSDGQTNTGYDFNQVSKIAAGFNIPIYTIGYNADLEELQKISSINEAASINADSDDVVYTLKNLFNAQM